MNNVKDTVQHLNNFMSYAHQSWPTSDSFISGVSKQAVITSRNAPQCLLHKVEFILLTNVPPAASIFPLNKLRTLNLCYTHYITSDCLTFGYV